MRGGGGAGGTEETISSKKHEICQYFILGSKNLKVCSITITTALLHSKRVRTSSVSEVASRHRDIAGTSRDCQDSRTAVNMQNYMNAILTNFLFMTLNLKYKMDKWAKEIVLTLECLFLQDLWFLRSLISNSGQAGSTPCPACSRGMYC